jgi:hypothetical protein
MSMCVQKEDKNQVYISHFEEKTRSSSRYLDNTA